MADWQILGASLYNVIQSLIEGILIGGVYSLVALGIVVINKASGVFNFAQGYMMLIGGLFFLQFFNSEPSTGMIFGISGISALLILGVLGSLGITFSLHIKRNIATPSLQAETPRVKRSSVQKWLEGQIKERRLQGAMLGCVAIWLGAGYFFMHQDKPNTTFVYIASAVLAVLMMVGYSSIKGVFSTSETLANNVTSKASNFEWRTMLVGIGIGVVLWIALGLIFLRTGREDAYRGAVGAFVVSIVIGLLIERFAIRPLLGQPILTAILMTLAVGFILQGVIQLIWGPDPRPVPIFNEKSKVVFQEAPAFDENGNVLFDEEGQLVMERRERLLAGKALADYTLNTDSWLGQDLRLRRNLTWGFAIAVSTFVGFVVIFRYTPIGLAMRATSENQTLAESVGLRVRLILAIAWAAVSTMAAVAGVVQGTGSGGLNKDLIPSLALRVFPAVLLGGLDSITGALVGGLLIGLIESLSILYISSTAAQELMPFLALMIVLMIRPDGLFGQRRIERV